MPADLMAFRGARGAWAAAWVSVVLLFCGIHAAPPASAAEPIPNPLSFIDFFNSGRLDGWTVHDEGTISAPSKWQVVNYQLKQSSNIYGGSTARSDIRKPGSNIVAGNAAWKNYDFSLRMRTYDDDGVGVVFRYADKNNHYRFSMDRQRGYQRLVKKVNGVYTLLAQNSRGYATNTSYLLRVVAVGSSLQILVDGVVIFTVNDGSLSAGKFGMYTWGSNNTIFDSLSARVQNDTYFTVAVVPDTQYASESYPAMFASQMRYLAARRADLNLALVLHSGDVVDEAAQQNQWNNAKTSLSYLSSKIPFVVAAGNHDVFDLTDTPENRYKVHRTPFNTLISGLKNYSVSGTYLPADYLNTYYLLSAGGVDILVLNLEFGANDSILAWAATVVDRYPNRHVMVVTHDYLSEKNQHRGVDPADKYLPKTYNSSMNNGIDMWREFVSQHRNVQFVFNGHVIEPTNATVSYSVGRLVSGNDAGLSVHQVLANYQMFRPAGRGYLRLVRFYPAQRRMEVRTYSPYENASLTDPLNQFSLSDVDLAAWPAPQQ